MPQTLDIGDKEPIPLETALRKEINVINLLSYKTASENFRDRLWEQRESIAALVKHHLGLAKQDTCVVLPVEQWFQGAFNRCVLVEVSSKSGDRKVVFRCPMPHKLAEAKYPGSINEKLSGEVGASIWIEENCPEIRSAFLFGFGFSDGRHFTHAKYVSLFPRLVRRFWRFVHKILRLPLLSNYVRKPLDNQGIDSAYMVLEYIGPETGRMLSETFETHREDKSLRQRLFRSMSRILLSLARIPQARIGSFEFHNNGTITLTNRPLSCSMMILENKGAPMTMPRKTTYNCTDAFVSDTITFHDHRFLSQPNAIFSEQDCRGQMTVKTLLRVFSHRHINRELRNGPFVLQLTDYNQSNILVDKYWNITGFIDLEWICALPSEMLRVPYWITDRKIDQIEGEELERFDQVRREFMLEFEEEEQATRSKARHSFTLSRIMHETWDSKGAWFWECLQSVNAMYFLLESHLVRGNDLPIETEGIVSKFWCRDPEEVVQKKMADKEAYNDELRNLVQEQTSDGSPRLEKESGCDVSQ